MLALAAPLAAGARPPPDGRVTAARRTGRIEIDGRLEEPDWTRAPAYGDFVQLFPTEGAAPTQRTEVRVLYDDQALYVGVTCHDSHPAGIVRTLGRRDRLPYSDAVMVVVDSTHEGRTAYEFTVTAAGVQEDGIFYDDDQLSTDWDAVWDAAVATTADGWTAELRIPLAALRFSDAPSQTWGFGVKRTVARLHEESASVLIRRSQRGLVSRLGTLVGLEDLHPVADLELAPYLAARAALRPRFADPTVPQPRVLDPVGDVGLDLKSSLGRGLALQGTVNPDFGQVEADQIILNLSRFEAFFPEKRPFFTQGMDLFQSVPGGSGSRPSPQQMFYSRRIGLDAPILGAAKLSGKASDEVQIGLLEAFVTGEGTGVGPQDASGAPQAAPHQIRFLPAQPLHLAPYDSLPFLSPAPRNFLVGTARWQPAPTRTFGLTATSALLAGPACSPQDAFQWSVDTDYLPRRCDTPAGNALAGDWTLRSADGDWFFRGQATGSQWLGSAPLRALPDGTVFHKGDLGYGAYASAGTQGGEPWRFEGQWYYESPRLELNALGYQRTQNEQLGRAILHWVKPNGVGPFHSVDLQLGAETHWTTDGGGWHRGSQLWAGGDFQLRSFHSFGCLAALDAEYWDVREIDRSGVFSGRPGDPAPQPGTPYRRPGDYGAQCWLSSDPNGPFHVEGGGGIGRTFATGPLAPVTFWGAGLSFVLRPQARVETRIDLQYDQNRFRARYVDHDLDPVQPLDTYTFADLYAPDFSVTLRQQLVLTPRLTLQAYAQLFTSYGHYGPYYTAAAPPGQAVTPSSLLPIPAPPSASASYDFRDVALNVNVVLRWEYRLGSTLYLVYTRSQVERGLPDGAPVPATLRPTALGPGPTTDTFMVKWAYWWSR